MDDNTLNEAIHTPSTKTEKTTSNYPEWIPMVAGEHFGHIVKPSIKDVSFAREGIDYKATVYNFFVEIATENHLNKYRYIKDGLDRITDGRAYAGKKIKAKGVFKITEPANDPNTQYLRFCEDLNIKLKDKTTTLDGKEVMVKEIPNLTVEDIEGKPVIAVVKEGTPWVNSNGDTRKGWDVKFTKRWEGGKEKTQPKESTSNTAIDNDELPF